ncbi:MAG: carbamoyltransferase HypF [Gloeobacterales cyanobacterium]
MNQNKSHQRLSVFLQGVVQGVGFRPFIYRLAAELELVGWVNNSAQGVFLEVEGSQEQLEIFLQRMKQEKPAHASIQSLTSSCLEPVGYRTFEIRPSTGGQKSTLVLPDRAICPDCSREILDPTDRRYHYPFTNCIHCGPRFSILEALPYDRAHTTMKSFRMCDHCQTEYEQPLDRRFHAQPNACPECGPQLALWEANGSVLASGHEALLTTANALRQGLIVAIKGLGGFHLVVDARNREAVLRLRQRKQRKEKPFALIYPSLEMVRAEVEVSDLEEKLLSSPEAPIVLLRRQRGSIPVEEVAPGNPYLGIMLPYTPLHYLLMTELGFPVVATSGNLAQEPICTDEYEALQRLGSIADLFLVHNRPIARPVDDSILRVVVDRALMLRRARGYAPLPIKYQAALPPLLAVGAHLKNTIAISVNQHIFVSQHIGDLETVQALETFQKTMTNFQQLYELHPKAIVCDTHPDYPSTHYAQQSGLPVISVQHHYAHVLSCMAENNLTGSVLGIAWDGTGYGLDGTIWGGEYLSPSPSLLAERGVGERSAHLRTFRLPGGAQAIREPRRAAIGLLYELFGEAIFSMKDLAPIQAFSDRELKVVSKILTKHLNAPRTSSVGRLFDAVSSLVGLRHKASFEGQAAMDLEFALAGLETDEQYEFDMVELEKPFVIDWTLMVKGVLEDLGDKVPVGKISAKFHNTLVETIITVAKRVGETKVVLSGGCFQNKYLTERAVHRLRQENLEPYWHRQIPPNDGGIALGQLLAAAHMLRR